MADKISIELTGPEFYLVRSALQTAAKKGDFGHDATAGKLIQIIEDIERQLPDRGGA